MGISNALLSEVFDPRVIYDPYHQRFICVSAAFSHEPTAEVLIGVSLSSNPTNGWHLWRIKADTNGEYWADAPTVGFNRHWIVLQANMGLITSNGTSRSYFWIFDKTNLYAGNLSYVRRSRIDPSPTEHISLNEIPATTFDNSLSSLYLLQNANGNTNNGTTTNNSGWLRAFAITGPIDDPILTNLTEGASYICATNATWADRPIGSFRCGFAPQKNGDKLGTSADSRLHNVIYRNGFLWCAQTIFLPAGNPTRSAVQWWQIKPDTREVIRLGQIDSETNFYAFPTIAVNRFNDLLIGYSSFGTDQFPSANYSFRGFDDGLENNDLRDTFIFQAGLTNYSTDHAHGACAWGDYSATVVDPVNDIDLWTIQEYSRSNWVFCAIPDPPGCADFGTNGYWGVQWASLKMIVPGNDYFSAPFTISGVQGATNGTLTRATRDENEPNHAGNANTPSVWYRWTAPTNGHVTFTASGRPDSVLAVYTGNAIGSLTPVTSQHGGTAGSSVVFNAASNIIYQIAVAGWNGDYGPFTLNWNQPTVPFFTLQPRDRDVYMGSNVTFTAHAIGVPEPSCQWRFNGANISGATDSSYTKLNVQTNDTGNFTVVASNTAGSATSQVAHLEVYSTQRALITEPSYVAASNYLRMIVGGITGAQYVVEASTNLVSWVPINTNFTTFTNFDYQITNLPYRFYRILYVP